MAATKSVTKFGAGVGEAIRRRRHESGLSMEKLAKKIGCTWQQLYKYERGQNRITVDRLYLIARALGVEVGSFFPEE